jgi:spore germination cell wall hydrolase CwlJ-like protein
MVSSRKRPKGLRRYGPFGLGVLALSLVPRQIGYQDLVALMARQTEAPQRARAHMMASPFGTIHAATFSLPQPVGTLIPQWPSHQLAGIDPADPDSTGSLGLQSSGNPMQVHRPRLDFPAVNRRLKGDLLVTRPRDEEIPAEGSRDLTPGRVKTVAFPKPADTAANEPKSEADVLTAALSPRLPTSPKTSPAARPAMPAAETLLEEPVDDSNPAARLAQLYFGTAIGDNVGTIQPWPADEEVLIEAPANDPDLKKTVVASLAMSDFNYETAGAVPMPQDPAAAEWAPLAGQTVAAKGEVTGASKRPRSPAEKLNLDARQRAKSEKCLAEAVYFESRGEPKRGQIAVAQVVMNRVFSGFYPNTVCGTVYQNAHRKNACQFTFACDGIPDTIEEPDMWQQAKDIARDMLDGKLWLPEIGHSTHYHAYWVHPSWVNEMRKLHKIGVHSFYRPRAWGDSVEVPNHPFVAPQAKM